MRWSEILTAIGGFGALAAVLGFVFSKLFERALEHRLRILEEGQKAQIADSLRKSEKLFDAQLTPFRSCVSLVHRIDRIAVNFALYVSYGDPPHESIDLELESAVRDTHDFLVSERSVIPPHVAAEVQKVVDLAEELWRLMRRYNGIPLGPNLNDASDEQKRSSYAAFLLFRAETKAHVEKLNVAVSAATRSVQVLLGVVQNK